MAGVSLKSRVQFTPRNTSGQFIAAKVTPGVIASVAAAQGLIVQEAQSICPVRTGALRDSIKPEEPDDSGKTVVGAVVASAPYAGYVEYGTGIRGAASAGAGPYPYSPTWPGMEARPFLRPSLDTAREAVKAVFASQLAISLKT